MAGFLSHRMDHVGRRVVTPRVRTSGGRRDRRRGEAGVIPTLKRREAFQKKDLRMWRQGFGMGGTKKGPRGWRLEGMVQDRVLPLVCGGRPRGQTFQCCPVDVVASEMFMRLL